ncbi:MAG TPA: lipoate protein ligase C-terminal domain-containing protein [Anaerolineales bacterium]|nr:lipoate protein ligase C-terminal domain-containing protein [Anaerolineales bacterium]
MMNWRLITVNNGTASFGLAADEALAQRVGMNRSQPTLRLYTYRSHCVLVGRFQNIENEIRVEYCRANGIPLNRRPTGGGAIIMGADQLGVALTIPGRGEDNYAQAREMMSHFSEGLVRGLNQLGVDAKFRRKNDIEVNGKKLVGLGVYRASSGGLLFHASLLVDLDIALMLQVLNTPFEKISDKEIDTVAGRITTVRRETESNLSVDELRRLIADGFAGAFNLNLLHADGFTRDELDDIAKLENEKYLTDDWVHQTTSVPDSNGSAKIKTDAGLIDVGVTMAGALIKAAFIGGDFFAEENAIADLEASLRWHASQPEKVAATIGKIFQSRKSEFNGIQPEVITEAVMKAVSRARMAESQMRADPYGCYVKPGGGVHA